MVLYSYSSFRKSFDRKKASRKMGKKPDNLKHIKVEYNMARSSKTKPVLITWLILFALYLFLMILCIANYNTVRGRDTLFIITFLFIFATMIFAWVYKQRRKIEFPYTTLWNTVHRLGSRHIGLIQKIDPYYDEGLFYFAAYLDEFNNLQYAKAGPVFQKTETVTYPKYVLEQGGDLICVLYEFQGKAFIDEIAYDDALIQNKIKKDKEAKKSSFIRDLPATIAGCLWLIACAVLQIISNYNPSVDMFIDKICSYCFNSRLLVVFIGFVIFFWEGNVIGLLIDNRRKSKNTYLEDTLKEIDWITSLKEAITKENEKHPEDNTSLYEALPPWTKGERIDRDHGTY